MINDPIVEEVRQVRDQHAARFNYDLKAIVADLRKQEKKSSRKFVRLTPKKPIQFPKRSLSKDVKVS
jgi:hypothetical protein